MDPIMWDFRIPQTGGSLSNFQMEVPGNLHSERPHMRRHYSCHDRSAVRQGCGFVVKAALAMPPQVISLYAVM